MSNEEYFERGRKEIEDMCNNEELMRKMRWSPYSKDKDNDFMEFISIMLNDIANSEPTDYDIEIQKLLSGSDLV